MIRSDYGVKKLDTINRRMFILSAAKIVVFGGTSGIGLSTTILLSKMNAECIYSISRTP